MRNPMAQVPEIQVVELEALEAIYYNELSVVSRTPVIKFTITLKLDDQEEVDEEDEFSVKLWFELPKNYPEEVPMFGIEESNNLLEEDEKELLDLLKTEAESIVGAEMIFLLVSTAKEWLNNRKDDDERRKEETAEKKKKEIEEAELKRFDGTRVTVESFMKWKLKFDAEMALLKDKQEKEALAAMSRKLTGRQLFEKDKTLNESDLKFLEEDNLGLGKEISYDATGVAVDVSLFDELDSDDDDDEDWVPE